jgi:hypothetical protein
MICGVPSTPRSRPLGAAMGRGQVFSGLTLPTYSFFAFRSPAHFWATGPENPTHTGALTTKWSVPPYMHFVPANNTRGLTTLRGGNCFDYRNICLFHGIQPPYLQLSPLAGVGAKSMSGRRYYCNIKLR